MLDLIIYLLENVKLFTFALIEISLSLVLILTFIEGEKNKKNVKYLFIIYLIVNIIIMTLYSIYIIYDVPEMLIESYGISEETLYEFLQGIAFLLNIIITLIVTIITYVATLGNKKILVEYGEMED